jgi:hypothetical protein
MATPKLETEVQVMFFDTDAGGVVHNIAYLRFIETNRSLLAEKLGGLWARCSIMATARWSCGPKSIIESLQGFGISFWCMASSKVSRGADSGAGSGLTGQAMDNSW